LVGEPGKEAKVFRALSYLLILFALAWIAFHYLEEGELPVVGGSFSDATTLASVKAALALHRDLSRRPISVRARGGVVTLTGEVASSDEKQEVEDLVSSVDGVDDVENLVSVSPDLSSDEPGNQRSLGDRLDDATLTAKVKAAFALHRELKNLDVNVHAREGTVYLEGTVENPSLAEAALAWARTVDGVQDVENLLDIGGQRETADQLAARVERVLGQNESLGRYGLNAVVRNGVIVLEGEVETGAERQLAELLAERAIGHRDVRNAIRLTTR